MKGVDRDFDSYGTARGFWSLAYALAVLGILGILVRFWDEVHLHGWSSLLLIRVVELPFISMVPLILSLQSRRYFQSALKENLVSERVAKNNEYFLGIQLMIAYLAIMQLAMWN